MSIVNLLDVMPRPAHPIEQGITEEWPAIEERLGTTLPEDYKDYINVFGTGTIGHLLTPFNPFSPNPHLNLLEQSTVLLDVYRDIRSYESLPFSLFPEPDGLLPWGGTANGAVLFWLTSDYPNAWTVVIHSARDVGFERHDCDMTTFLRLLLTDKLNSRMITYASLNLAPTFSQDR